MKIFRNSMDDSWIVLNGLIMVNLRVLKLKPSREDAAELSTRTHPKRLQPGSQPPARVRPARVPRGKRRKPRRSGGKNWPSGSFLSFNIFFIQDDA